MNRRNLWAAWAVVVGAAFAIVAFAHAKGFVYLVIAVIAAAGYSVIHRVTRKPPAAEPPGAARSAGQSGPG